MNELTSLTSTVMPWVQRYGYAAVAVGVGLEGMGIPLPGATLMGGAAVLAGRGELSLAGVLATAWGAAVAGDNLGYLLGRWGGRRLLLRVGVSRPRLQRLNRFYTRYGAGVILVGRFVDGTRQLDGLVAGSARMPWARFFMADVVGAAAWVGFWVAGLDIVSRHSVALLRVWQHLNPVWLAAGVVAALGLGLLLVLRRR